MILIALNTVKQKLKAINLQSYVETFRRRLMENIQRRLTRPLDPIYPILYLDCIVVKIRQERSCWAYGCLKMKGLNFGWAC